MERVEQTLWIEDVADTTIAEHPGANEEQFKAVVSDAIYNALLFVCRYDELRAGGKGDRPLNKLRFD
jgi:hypothetical protein